jgi:hypothetical protein
VNPEPSGGFTHTQLCHCSVQVRAVKKLGGQKALSGVEEEIFMIITLSSLGFSRIARCSVASLE